MQQTVGLVEPFGHGLAFPDWLDIDAPAAGAVKDVKVPGGYWMRPLGARLSITTSADVADRLVTIDYLDARGITRLRNGAGLVVEASTTAQTFEWNSHRTLSEWAEGTPVFAPLAPFFLPPGFVIRYNVTGIQATDAISGLSLWYEQFATGNLGMPLGPYTVAPDG